MMKFHNVHFMPLGEDFYPEDLAILSLNMKNAGFEPISVLQRWII